ncbi:type II secretion system F family protein [Sphingomonas sp.]|uniref:type II secretion system F family protein n=1 Tax=Sphingomonas sp. TaxID=28214 RepID=UPI003B00FCA7
MTAYRYRAVDAAGGTSAGALDALDREAALAHLRALGLMPIAVDEGAAPKSRSRIGGAGRRAAVKAIGELGVLLGAGLPIDRALALAIDNIEHAATRTRLEEALRQVREGVPLSRALGQAAELFPPMAQAMIEAGEANGRLADAMARLAATLEAREEMRSMIVGQAVYPVALLVIAVGVILLMLLFVIPQFETVFASTPNAKLPAASLAIMAASRFTRDYGLVILLLLVLAVPLGVRALRAERVRAGVDRMLLDVPQVGTIVRYAETAQLARTLGVLVTGGVDLPVALAMARRSIGNRHMGAAVDRAATTLREGGGLTAPLAATGVLPRLAVGFLRTGEETSSLGPMLDRLADVLDREVRLRIERLVAVLTPAITVLLGGIVATVIASIMTAILGFNDLALG